MLKQIKLNCLFFFLSIKTSSYTQVYNSNLNGQTFWWRRWHISLHRAEKSSALLDPSPDLMEGMEETSSSAPPPSLVPRLHAISVCQLQHNNPLLSSAAGSVIQGSWPFFLIFFKMMLFLFATLLNFLYLKTNYCFNVKDKIVFTVKVNLWVATILFSYWDGLNWNKLLPNFNVYMFEYC